MHDAHVSQKFVSTVTTYPLSKESRSSTRRRSSSEAQVAGAEPLEGGAIRSNDVRIDRVCRRNQPCVVLTHPTRSAPLQERTAACLCQVKTLYRKPLQRSCGCNGVDCAFEQFLDGDDRNHERSPAQRRQEPARRALFAGSGLAIKVDQKGRVQQTERKSPTEPGASSLLLCEAQTSRRVDPLDQIIAGLNRTDAIDQGADHVRFRAFTATRPPGKKGCPLPIQLHRDCRHGNTTILPSMPLGADPRTTGVDAADHWHTDARRGPTCSMGQVIVRDSVASGKLNSCCRRGRVTVEIVRVQ
jgi:hypothetical protein